MFIRDLSLFLPTMKIIIHVNCTSIKCKNTIFKIDTVIFAGTTGEPTGGRVLWRPRPDPFHGGQGLDALVRG